VEYLCQIIFKYLRHVAFSFIGVSGSAEGGEEINLSFIIFHVIVWQVKEFIFVIDVIYK
jgi:hypothetical protein